MARQYIEIEKTNWANIIIGWIIIIATFMSAFLIAILTPSCSVPSGFLIIIGMIFMILVGIGLAVLSEYKKTVKKYVKTEKG